MTARQIKLIEDSWDFVIMNTQEAGVIFYGKLFELDPSLRPMFKEDIKAQADKLVSMISFIVSKINSLDDVIKDVKQLGKRHSRYQVKESQYATVAAALLSTLEAALPDTWNEEMKEAWVTVYTVLSTVMKEGAKELNQVS